MAAFIYLPLVTQNLTTAESEQVNAALFGWLWPTQTPDRNFSLKIEKRNFDAGGDGASQLNLLLIPRIIDLLDLLTLSENTAKKVWGLQNTQLDRAQGLSSGSGVTVAVLDTGVSILTSELFLRTVAGYDFVDNDRYPYEAPNWRDDDRDGQTDEGSGHGTFVSSIIAAATRSARIMPIRVLNSDGNGTPEMVAKGIRYAADRGANIINLSLSSDLDDAAVRDAITYAAGKGIVIVAAALSSDSQVGFPAGYAPVISVGAIDRNNTIPDFVLGNAGQIDVFAPGAEIYGPALFGRNVWMSGNSMATAFVSAEAALLMQGGRCNAACVNTILTSRVNPVVPDQAGRGRVDAYQALLNRPQ
jgi:subtilisin family serine protease